MSKKPEKRGLGRGLSALMADVNLSADSEAPASPDAPRRSDLVVPVEKLVPNPDQPRRHFAEEALQELAESIKEKGVIQPLIVRPNKRRADTYEIVAGERRWRASQMAQQHEVPIIVRDFDDTEVLEVAIIENIQRSDLNAIEEAAGYSQLMERFGHTQEKLSQALGKSRSHIANLMRLLQLPEDVKQHVVSGALSAGHARALVTANDPGALAQRVIKGGLSVRETERLAKLEKTPIKPKKPKNTSLYEKDADTRALEADLSAALGLKVDLDHREGSEAGKISIQYRDLEQLDQLCQLLSKGL